MALYVYQSNRVENLVHPFAGLLAKKEGRLLQKETVLVQSIGMGRYFVTQAARLNGICANFEFIYPQNFFNNLCRQFGTDPRTSDKNQTAWNVYRLIKENHDTLPDVLKKYVDGSDELKLFKLALSIGDTFDQYTMYRTDSVNEWDKQNPVIIQNGNKKPVEEEFLWQYEIWRALSGEKTVHRAALLEELTEKIRAHKGGFTRLFALGLSNLPPFYLKLLYELAQKGDVYLMLLNPSPSYWYDIISERSFIQKEILKEYSKTQSGDHYYYMGNPLLSLYGTQGRDFYAFLLEADARSSGCFDKEFPETLLGTIQKDIFNLRDRTEFSENKTDRFTYTDGDLSLTVHGCHNRMREMEIIHDQILSFFDDDPELKPGDILVMTPSITEFEPYITAVLDTNGADGSPLPYTIADLSVADTNRMAETLIQLMALESERLTLSLLCDMLECDEVCRAYNIPLNERKTVITHLHESGFRWGIDFQDRVENAGVGYEEYSLVEAYRKLCAGISYDNETAGCSGIRPAVNFESGMLQTAGAILEYISDVSSHARMFQCRHSLVFWKEYLASLIGTFFSPAPGSEGRLSELYEAVEKISAGNSQFS